MSRTALLLVDIQNDYFPNGSWPVENIAAAADNAARLLADARQSAIQVIHIRHEATRKDAPFFVPDSTGAQIHTSVAALKGETVITKKSANSFHETDLLAALQARDITSLIICGAMSQMCIDATTRAAKDYGFAVTLVHDACAARAITFDGVTVPAASVHAAFIGALGMSYATLVATEDFLAG